MGGTFAERGTSPKQRMLLEYTDSFKAAMFLMEGNPNFTSNLTQLQRLHPEPDIT